MDVIAATLDATHAGSYAELRAFAGAWGLTQPRILAMFIAVPLFARQLMPGLLRFGLAGGIGLIAAPPLVAQLDQVPQGLALALWVSKEAGLGFVLGLVLAIPFWAFEAAGFFIDNQRGASIAATLNPLTGNDSSPMGQLFNQAFIVFVLVSGAFGLLLSVLYESFLLWPVLDWRPAFAADGAALWLGQLDALVRTAIVWSAPVIVAMFLAELGLALVSRFAPQLQVFFVALPVKSALALLVLVVYMGTLLQYAGEWTREQWGGGNGFLQRVLTLR
jgi:type III secretion protein T